MRSVFLADVEVGELVSTFVPRACGAKAKFSQWQPPAEASCQSLCEFALPDESEN